LNYKREDFFRDLKKGVRKLPRITLLDPIHESAEHPSRIVPVVILEGVFVQVALQVFGRHGVADTLDHALQEAPKAFYRIRVNVSRNVDLFGVVNSIVPVALSIAQIVNRVFVRIDQGFR
jgi:hypothetical protein